MIDLISGKVIWTQDSVQSLFLCLLTLWKFLTSVCRLLKMSQELSTLVCSFSEETGWQALEPKHPWLEEKFVQWATLWGVYWILRVFSEVALKGFSEGCPVGRIWSWVDHWTWGYFNLVVPTLGQIKGQTYDIKLSVEWLLYPMKLSCFCSMKAVLFHFILYSGVGWRREKTRKNSFCTENK